MKGTRLLWLHLIPDLRVEKCNSTYPQIWSGDAMWSNMLWKGGENAVTSIRQLPLLTVRSTNCLPASLKASEQIFLTLSVLEKKKKIFSPSPALLKNYRFVGTFTSTFYRKPASELILPRKKKTAEPCVKQKCFPGPLIVDLCGLHVSPVQTLSITELHKFSTFFLYHSEIPAAHINEWLRPIAAWDPRALQFLCKASEWALIS